MFKRGFTLIELLVVIAIIGVLASVVLSSINSARSKARDSSAASNLSQIRLALELYYSDHGEYPHQGAVGPGNQEWLIASDSASCWGPGSYGFPDGETYALLSAPATGFSAYMPSPPPAPRPTECLWYQVLDSHQEYMLGFVPENESFLERDHDCHLSDEFYCLGSDF